MAIFRLERRRRRGWKRRDVHDKSSRAGFRQSSTQPTLHGGTVNANFIATIVRRIPNGSRSRNGINAFGHASQRIQGNDPATDPSGNLAGAIRAGHRDSGHGGIPRPACGGIEENPEWVCSVLGGADGLHADGRHRRRNLRRWPDPKGSFGEHLVSDTHRKGIFARLQQPKRITMHHGFDGPVANFRRRGRAIGTRQWLADAHVDHTNIRHDNRGNWQIHGRMGRIAFAHRQRSLKGTTLTGRRAPIFHLLSGTWKHQCKITEQTSAVSSCLQKGHNRERIRAGRGQNDYPDGLGG